MSISTTIRFVCSTILLLATQFLAAAENGFSDAEAEAIQAFLRENFGNTNAGMVIGLVDERSSRVLAAGKLDNGTFQDVNGDTVFEIGSVTKTFTTLLLQDMVERDEVKLDDPVAKYLPESVKVPARDGKQITLLNLATHTGGLPRDPGNLTPGRGLPENAFADYTVEKLYAFLSSFALDREPGSKFEYSNVGMALLGHILALKTGTNYEALVVEQICRPLKMNSTRITLTPELQAHAGGTGGYETFIGINKDQRRGVVVLSSRQGGLSPETIGWLLLTGVRLSPEIAIGLSAGTNMVGIGVALDFDAKTRTVRITKVITDSPASESGLSPGLVVQRIDGVATADKSLTECVGRIRGKPGTKIRLELFDPKQNATNLVELTRRRIQM